MTLMSNIKPGIYRVRESIAPDDPELEHGLLEVYVHPVKGLCFYNQGLVGDFDGHIPIRYLEGEHLEPVDIKE